VLAAQSLPGGNTKRSNPCFHNILLAISAFGVGFFAFRETLFNTLDFVFVFVFLAPQARSLLDLVTNPSHPKSPRARTSPRCESEDGEVSGVCACLKSIQNNIFFPK
jgi:hypothetical protein